VRGGVQDAGASGGVLDDGEDVLAPPGRGGRFDEVDGLQGLRLAAEEVGPGAGCSVWCGIDALGAEDLPHGRAGRDGFYDRVPMSAPDVNTLLVELATLLPPPPAAIVSPPWHESVARVGFAFPSDYQAFAARYGCGGWSSENKQFDVGIWSPTSAELWPDSNGFERFVAEGAVSYQLPTDAPGYDFVPFPGPGSLLTFGGNEAGDRLMWHVTGPDSDLWPVVVCAEGYDGSMYPFDGGMLAFLVALMRGDLETSEVLVGRRPVWTTHCDWTRLFEVSAGPAVAVPGWL
jgi:hypothetical protein